MNISRYNFASLMTYKTGYYSTQTGSFITNSKAVSCDKIVSQSSKYLFTSLSFGSVTTETIQGIRFLIACWSSDTLLTHLVMSECTTFPYINLPEGTTTFAPIVGKDSDRPNLLANSLLIPII